MSGKGQLRNGSWDNCTHFESSCNYPSITVGVSVELTVFLESVASQGCPEQYGVQTYEDPEYCDQFYLCVNGTLTHERCENGLLFDGHGNIHNHCNYNWAVECGNRKADCECSPTTAPSPDRATLWDLFLSQTLRSALRGASTSSVSTKKLRPAAPTSSSVSSECRTQSRASRDSSTTKESTSATGPTCSWRSAIRKVNKSHKTRRSIPSKTLPKNWKISTFLTNSISPHRITHR